MAGGESRRFGRNKALEPYRGKRFIDHCVESLRTHCEPVLLVANDLSLYYDVDATLIRDVITHQGPLGGIYTALLFSPWEWVLVKATDMPFLVVELVQMMARSIGRNPRIVNVPMPILATMLRLLGREADLVRLSCPFVIQATRSHEALGWRPPYRLQDEIAWTVALMKSGDRAT